MELPDRTPPAPAGGTPAQPVVVRMRTITMRRDPAEGLILGSAILNDILLWTVLTVRTVLVGLLAGAVVYGVVLALFPASQGWSFDLRVFLGFTGVGAEMVRCAFAETTHASLGSDGIWLHRRGGRRRFVAWTAVVSIRPVGRAKVFLHGWLWTGLRPAAPNFVSWPGKGYYLIEWIQDDETLASHFLPPADEAAFRAAVSAGAPYILDLEPSSRPIDEIEDEERARPGGWREQVPFSATRRSRP